MSPKKTEEAAPVAPQKDKKPAEPKKVDPLFFIPGEKVKVTNNSTLPSCTMVAGNTIVIEPGKSVFASRIVAIKYFEASHDVSAAD